uniref:TROVE domain-containing protein n=1 Tax=Strigamia maritima TaxID=126957 RepID=T1JIE1_STRMM
MQFDQLNCRKKLKMDEKPCRSLNLTGNSKLRNWQLEKGENIGRNVITRSALVLNSTRLIRPTSNNLNLLHNKLLNRNDLKVSVLTKNRNLNLSTYNKNRLRNSLLDSNLKKLQLKNKLLETKHTQQPTTINVLLIKHSNTTKLSDVVDQNELEEEFFEDILDGIAVQVPRYTFDDFSTRKKRIVPNDFLRKDIRLLSDPKTQTKISFVNAVSSSLISGPNLKLKDDQIRCIIVDYARETAQFDPEFVLKVAVYTRRELNIRSTANLLVAFAASNTECKPYLEKYFNCIIRLPSDWIEVAEQCQLFLTEEKKSRSLPAALRRAMVSKFGEFDEYQLAKYNKVKKVKKEVKTMTLRRQPRTYATAVRGDESKNDLKIVFSLKILIRSLHLSKPANFVMGILQRKYPQNLADFWSSGLPGMWDEERSGKRMKLATPETWETQLCLHGNRALIWEKLIDDKKLPFMAMLRNLRNLIIAKISEDHHRKIISILKDKELVMRSKQFPFRFLTAYNILCDLEKRSAEVKLMRSNQLGKTEKWLRKTRKLSTGTITDISKRYKTALNKSIDISTLNNIAPIKGHSIILCDCNADMESRCATTKSLHTQQKNRDIALLMALMCKHVCETSELHLFGSNGDTLVQLKKNTSILDNLNRITIELDENKGDARWNPLIPSSNPKEKGNEKFPARIFDNIFKDRTQEIFTSTNATFDAISQFTHETEK